MKDFNFQVDDLDQRAQATIEIVDYSTLAGKTVTITNGGGPAVLTEGVEWTAATSNDATATSLASAIDGIGGSGYSAEADGAIITLIADVAGADFNDLALETNVVDDIVLSGPNFEGGVDATYSDVFDYDLVDKVAIVAESIPLAGGDGVTADVSVEVSSDKEAWDEVYNFDTIGGDIGGDPQSKTINDCRNFARFKIVVNGGVGSLKVRMYTTMSNGENSQTKRLIEGRKVVAETGTAVALSDVSVNFRFLDVVGLSTNNADVSVGSENVDADAGEETGAILIANQVKRFTNGNLKDLFVNGTATEGVSWSGEA